MKPLTIALFDPSPAEYTPSTPRERPMGGTQASVCHLTATLAAAGHTVLLFNQGPGGGRAAVVDEGVLCAERAGAPAILSQADAMLVVNSSNADLFDALRAILPPTTVLASWVHLPPDQPANDGFRRGPGGRTAFDRIDAVITVGEWQRRGFLADFPLDPGRVLTMPNGLTPAFVDLFAEGPITPHKAHPPVLAYTSAPYRGLDRMLDALPRIQAAIPGTRLRVFSGMATQFMPEQDVDYRALYDRCARQTGVELIGPVPQPQLASRMKDVVGFVYPNTFAETFCIAALEGLAAGCTVVTSDLGGIPDTVAGFGHLVPVAADPAVHAAQFAEAVIAALQPFLAGDPADEARRRAQVDHVRATYSWFARRPAWERLLAGLIARRLGRATPQSV